MADAQARIDVAIVGLGVMGSAIALELAGRGLSVVGFDRFTPPHRLGSSHGESRIIREAYFEHPVYVPMVQRAFDLWRDLERAAHASLLVQTGAVMIGHPDGVLIEGTLRSAQLHHLEHAVLSASEIHDRFPALAPESAMLGVWEPRAGVLRVEACIEAQLAEARRAGATLRFDEPVERWESDGSTAVVVTAGGEVRARHLVIAAGPWVASLLPDMTLPFQVERQVVHWLEALPGQFSAQRCPVHLWQFDGDRFFYGLPDVGAGPKVAFHHGGEATTPDTVQRDTTPVELAELRDAIGRFLPEASGAIRESAVCLYTNTPDEHFLVDRHPKARNVVVASPCSGHGFKFAPVIGEIVADLVQDRFPRFDVSLFRWRAA